MRLKKPMKINLYKYLKPKYIIILLFYFSFLTLASLNLIFLVIKSELDNYYKKNTSS